MPLKQLSFDYTQPRPSTRQSTLSHEMLERHLNWYLTTYNQTKSELDEHVRYTRAAVLRGATKSSSNDRLTQGRIDEHLYREMCAKLPEMKSSRRPAYRDPCPSDRYRSSIKSGRNLRSALARGYRYILDGRSEAEQPEHCMLNDARERDFVRSSKARKDSDRLFPRGRMPAWNGHACLRSSKFVH